MFFLHRASKSLCGIPYQKESQVIPTSKQK